MNITGINGKTTLINGVQMPYLGLGVFQSGEGKEVIEAVNWSLEAGYRHIDTASAYNNEVGVGKAIMESGIDRSEIFITSKVWNSDQGYETTLKAFDTSLEKLKLDYLDLYLVHWPVEEKFADTWKALEELYDTGRVKAIGVSNFHIHHLEKLLLTANISPMVNQVEFHPYLQQPELFHYCKTKKIQYEAWSPLMQGKIINVITIQKLAEKHNKTPVQVVLRWNLQRGVVTIPKSVKRNRIICNANLFDFELSNIDMTLIDTLDRNERTGADPDNFDF